MVLKSQMLMLIIYTETKTSSEIFYMCFIIAYMTDFLLCEFLFLFFFMELLGEF